MKPNRSRPLPDEVRELVALGKKGAPSLPAEVEQRLEHRLAVTLGITLAPLGPTDPGAGPSLANPPAAGSGPAGGAGGAGAGGGAGAAGTGGSAGAAGAAGGAAATVAAASSLFKPLLIVASAIGIGIGVGAVTGVAIVKHRSVSTPPPTSEPVAARRVSQPTPAPAPRASAPAEPAESPAPAAERPSQPESALAPEPADVAPTSPRSAARATRSRPRSLFRASAPTRGAVAPPPAAPPPAASVPADRGGSTIGAERTLLHQAREALRMGKLDQASQALEEHRSRFADGQLVEEREALWIRLLARRGQIDRARAAAAAFRSRYPHSILLPVVNAALKESR